MDRAKIVDFYLKKLDDKSFEISDVREDLERNNFEENEIKVIVQLVDNELQKKLLSISINKRANDLIYIGGIVALIGVLMTIGTYTGLIKMGSSFLIAFGPIIAGLTFLLIGITSRKRA
jgi:hypothetical protein